MKPWIIDRIENRKQNNEFTRAPLRIQQPPPEWLEKQRGGQEPRAGDRGVTIIGGDEPTTDRGIFIIDL